MVFPSSMMYRWIISAVSLIAFKFVVNNVLLVRAAFAKIKDYPGRLMLWLQPCGAASLVLGPVFPRPGMVGCYTAGFSLYKKFGATSFATVWVTAAKQFFWLADPEAIKIVASDRHTFQKDVAGYEMINMYGGNLISSEGPHWKRHRSVAMSAFSEANIAMVWSESLRVVNEWFREIDAAGPHITLNMLAPLTKVAFLVIAAAGFGKRVSWTDESTTELPPGCRLTFQSAVLASVDNILFKGFTPEWFYQFSNWITVPYLSSRALLTQLAFDDLRIHMLDLVASARAEIASGDPSRASGAALLRNLVEANMSQNGDSKLLSDGELLSNIFAFLIAGHETVSHALCFATLLLALYPDCQQKIYEETTRVWSTDASLTQLARQHLDEFKYTEAYIRETLRVIPVEPRLWKDVSKDTVLPGTYFTPGSKENPSIKNGKFLMAIPAGSAVVIDILALHMNPLYWGEDAEEFRPERFIDNESYQWPRGAFLPFSGGARSCIGQRFALVEMVAILASLVQQYQIRAPDDLAEKPFEERKRELLKWTSGLALTPLNPHVKLSRRI